MHAPRLKRVPGRHNGAVEHEKNKQYLDQFQKLEEGRAEGTPFALKSCVDQDRILNFIAAGAFDKNGLTPYFDEVPDNDIRVLFVPPVAPSDRENVPNEKIAALCSVLWPKYGDSSCLVGVAARFKKNTHQAFREAGFSEYLARE